MKSWVKKNIHAKRVIYGLLYGMIFSVHAAPCKYSVDRNVVFAIKAQIKDQFLFFYKSSSKNKQSLISDMLAHNSDILVPDGNGISPLDAAFLLNDQSLVQNLIESSCTEFSVPASYQNDISFGIVDLKFDGENIKICELGVGQLSKFRGMDTLYKNGYVWEGVWKFLYAFEMPTWNISRSLRSTSSIYSEEALKFYSICGGKRASNLAGVLGNLVKTDGLPEHKHNFFTDNNAIIISKKRLSKDPDFDSSNQCYAKALFLGDALFPFGASKLLMHDLFVRANLGQFRPRCMVCKKTYSQDLAASIEAEMQSDCFVIKPINSAMGKGVIFTNKEDLDKTLRAILIDPQLLVNDKDTSYSHWAIDSNDVFIVEAYAPSKQILVRNQKYDPTMRVIYILMCDKGRIYLNFLGSYWKIPSKSLSAHGSLTVMHKSHVEKQKKSAVLVERRDYEAVKNILRSVLPEAYVVMLQDREMGKISLRSLCLDENVGEDVDF